MTAKTIKITRLLRTVPTRIRILPTTSNRSERALARGTKAFTLIEILIVLAIISMVMAVALPAIERVTNQKLNSTARKFVGTLHTIRNDAILLNSIHRLAIDFDHQTWWVEAQKEFKLLTTVDPELERKKKKRKKGEEPPSNFALVEKYAKKPIPMPTGVVFESVLKEKEGLFKAGVVYINFFPNGFNDYSILHLSKEGSPTSGYSLLVRPTSGKIEIFREALQSFDRLN